MNHSQLQINELTLILNEHFQWNKAKMACFVGMLTAIMIVSTVNLTQLALFFPSQATIASRYRRIQRFFHHHRLDYNEGKRAAPPPVQPFIKPSSLVFLKRKNDGIIETLAKPH